MTSEIALLNSSAIVLAADSAVTTGEAKVYNTANKLFMLSKRHPIGIMIYGNAGFMGVPWETLIKTFRKHLNNKGYESIELWANAFIDYLKSNKRIFTDEIQASIFLGVATDIFKGIAKRINDAFQIKIFSTTPPTGMTFPEIRLSVCKEIIAQEKKRYEKLELVDEMSLINIPYTKDKFRERLIKVINSGIGKENRIEAADQEDLVDIAVLSVTRKTAGDKSGVVIAGFGTDEIYPGYVEFQIENMFEDRLKYFESSKEVSVSRPIIHFFAQSESGKAFLRGIDFELRKKYRNDLYAQLASLKKKISGMSGVDVTAAETEIDKIFTNHSQAMTNYSQQFYTGPILKTIGAMPKEELAVIAETLVNITSFKKRVSGDDETVGGPIDVAVISKGDGFIWIKRKHYFEPKLNHHFFENYFE